MLLSAVAFLARAVPLMPVWRVSRTAVVVGCSGAKASVQIAVKQTMSPENRDFAIVFRFVVVLCCSLERRAKNGRVMVDFDG